MLNKEELIDMFVNNIKISSNNELKGSNLRAYYVKGTNTRVLKNYSTIIALVNCDKDYNKLVINIDHYSQTTTRNQNLLRQIGINNGFDIEEVDEATIYKMI